MNRAKTKTRPHAAPAADKTKETVLVIENTLEDRVRLLRRLMARRRVGDAGRAGKPAN